MKDFLKSAGWTVLGLGMMVVLMLIAVLFIRGGVWASEKILPIAYIVAQTSFWVCLLILMPLAVIDATKGFAGVALVWASYTFGALLFMVSLIFVYNAWGIVAIILGFMMMGIGVVFLAFLAALFKGMWSVL